MSNITVDDDGTVTGTTDAVAALLEAKPHLVRDRAERSWGSADQGAKGNGRQLTRDDLKTMNPAEINAARSDGRLNTLLGNT